MKKFLGILIAAALLLTVCVPSALAAGNHHGGYHRTNLVNRVHRACAAYGTCQNGWVDADGDGICDNCETAQCGNPANQNRPCRNWVDTNGDQVCDNYGTADCPGNGNCQNDCWVDEDHDGICDNYNAVDCPSNCGGTGSRDGMGYGAQQGGHGGGHHGGGNGRHCRW